MDFLPPQPPAAVAAAATTDASAATVPVFDPPSISANLDSVDSLSEELKRVVDSLAANPAENSQLIAAAQVIDAIPALIEKMVVSKLATRDENNFDYDDDDNEYVDCVNAIGASDTNVITNLKRLLDLIVESIKAASSAAAFIVSTDLEVKAIIAIQKLIYYDIDEFMGPCPFSEENMMAFVEVGIVGALIESVKSNFRMQQKLGEVADVRILTECFKFSPILAGTAALEAIELLTDILLHHSMNSAAVAESCCRAIEKMVACNDDVQTMLGNTDGAFEALVCVLQAHGASNAAMATACFSAIRNLTSYHEENCAKFGEINGLCDVLVDVLRAHGGSDATVVETWGMAVSNITANCSGIKEKFGSTDVFAALIDVLKQHGNIDASGEALKECCGVIQCLCKDNGANKAKFHELNVIQVLETEVTVDFWNKDETLNALR
jgi:hypothetical protein